jgi:signal transduction histidine kinase/ActR/RegA family two-component response regulator
VAQDTPAATTAAVHAEQIRTLYRQSLAIAAVNPLNAAIVAAVLWPSASPRLLIAWVVAMTAVTLVRAVMRHRYFRAQPSIDEHVVWARHLMWSALATGLLWGLGGAAFYDTRGLVPQLLPVFVIGGMVAGASGTLALHLPACLAFTASAILPVAVRMFAEGDQVHVAMSMLAIVFGVAMSLLAAHSNRAITEAFRLRVKNQDLLAQLSATQVSLEQTNQTLEQRVAERGAALERQSEALRDAQRMESVGLLAGGVAHDFNNLLTVVMGNVELLLGDKQHTLHDRSRLEEIQGASQRAATLVSQLLAFSRRQVMVRQVLDFNAVVADVQPLLTRLIGEHIELVISVAPTPLTVEADATQLQQTIINLATNARDAMAGGGTLTIETALVDGTPPGTTLPPRRWVVLTVRDTGIGMDATTRRMAFHPFFTTKGVGKGTGLGLASVHGIVEQSGGHVVVESEPGHGSCFSVFRPAARAETIEPAAAPRTLPAAGSSQPAMILVAEDEALVRAVTARVLDRAGYTVLEAEDGEQALEVLRRYHSTLDLVISDVVMAKLDGRELVRRVMKEWPGLPILLVSGYNPEELTTPDDPVGSVEFLMKPFTPSELLHKVSTLVGRSAGERSVQTQQSSV